MFGGTVMSVRTNAVFVLLLVIRRTRTQLHRIVSIGWVVVVALACNLARPTPTVNEVNPPSIRVITPTPADMTGCTVRSDWPTYEVQPGDNLTGIAQSIGTTVDVLMVANCLQNPDQLNRGQILYVPSFDDCPHNLMTATGTNFVSLTPYLSFEGNCYQLQDGASITVSFPGAPAGTVEVTFYRTSSNTMRPDVIGVDSNPADGFAIQWTAYQVPASVIYAMATGGQGSTSDPVGIYVSR
jgi:LysM repeat protein